MTGTAAIPKASSTHARPTLRDSLNSAAASRPRAAAHTMSPPGPILEMKGMTSTVPRPAPAKSQKYSLWINGAYFENTAMRM